MIDELIQHLEHVPPKMLKKLLDGFVWEGTPDSGTMALTFDDGPDPDVTPSVLDALEENSIRGTFFMLGTNAESYPDIASQVLTRGHLIGNHTMNHRKLLLMQKEEVECEIDGAQKAIAEATGFNPQLFRPPHGVFDFSSARVVKNRGLSMVLWTVLSGDYSDDPPSRIIKTVEPYIRAGSIVVFHDTVHGGGSALPAIIREISVIARQRGVRFGSINELTLSDHMEINR
ncbi:polysaccharide deacetylase family protein [Candidatus Latescibacterota bacterium]